MDRGRCGRFGWPPVGGLRTSAEPWLQDGLDGTRQTGQAMPQAAEPGIRHEL